MKPRGFSLAELMVALVIAGVIGLALTRLVISQARFVASQEGTMTARAGARAGFNVIVQELRMVTAGGLVAASPDSITVRVPFAYGVACIQPSGGQTAVALLPFDSANFAAASLSGYAWRDSNGVFSFEEPATLTNSSAPSTDCSSATPPVTVLTMGRVVRVSPNNVAAVQGLPVYLYQNVRYELAESVELPGRVALWRTVLATGTREELVTPFDTASAFAFLVGNGLTRQASPPAVLDSVRGIQLRLVGQSEDTPEGRTAPSRFDLTTGIVFVNRAR